MGRVGAELVLSPPPGILAAEHARDVGSPVFPLALLAASLLHLFLILTLSFEVPRAGPEIGRDQTMEVLILKDLGEDAQTPAPDAALSQRSRLGESTEGDGAVTTPADFPDLPEAPEAGPAVLEKALDEPDPVSAPGPELAEAPVPEPDSASEPQREQTPQDPVEADLPAQTPPSEIEPELEPPAPEPIPEVLTAPEPDPFGAPTPAVSDAAHILASRDSEIARLTASHQARTVAQVRRERRKSVSASTREFRYASYLAAWAQKVERIGNLNYPQAAKERQLYGNLILHVAVRRDGSVEAVRVVRSSGIDILDEAAVRIVELAAPYAPFPPDIAAETDVLDIVRTWQFQRSGRFGWE